MPTRNQPSKDPRPKGADSVPPLAFGVGAMSIDGLRTCCKFTCYKELPMKTIFAFACSAALVLGGLVSPSLAADELKVGDDAPNFELKGSDGKTYKLSDFKGKQAVVIAWFPRA